MSQPHMESFFQRILRMSDADTSVLEAALKMPDSGMATEPGSAKRPLMGGHGCCGMDVKKS